MAGEGKVEEDGKLAWYHRRGVVLALLFFALGPFALPLLYGSPRFSRNWKIILTMLVTVYTFYVIYASVEVTRTTLGILTGFGVSPF